MENQFVVSGRTIDLCPDDLTPRGLGLVVTPRGSEAPLRGRARLGHIGVIFMPSASASANRYQARIAALNEEGLSCDEQALNHSQYMQPSGDPTRDLSVHQFCAWAAGSFANVSELKAGLRSVNVIADPSSGDQLHHYVIRDSSGAGVLIEAIDGRLTVHDDLNDSGVTGFGVVTNAPPFGQQLAHARRAFQGTAPARGGWRSMDRFQRLALVKAALPSPSILQTAIEQTFTVMDTVDTPAGNQRGQDWVGEYTVVGLVRDHSARELYWRTPQNQQVQRLSLLELDLSESAARRVLPIGDPSLPWFHNASAALRPIGPVV